MNIGVLGSGTGSNYAAIAAAIAARRLANVTVTLVLADVESAGILDKARQNGHPCRYLPASDFKTKLDGPQEQAYIAALRDARVDYVVLAGFMRMLKPALLTAFARKIINIHPALLPAFPGLQSWKQALEYGAKVAGCTVHFVDEGMDTGPIIAQAAVPVLDTDTAASLHARIQEQEHELYPRVLHWLAEGRVHVEGRRVKVE
jgi:phosphoribosylglycinamide formyltransferase-1